MLAREYPLLPFDAQGDINRASALEWTVVRGRRPMFRKLTTSAGRRVACFFALAYLACVIAPSIALAFADGAVTAYCFDEIAQVATPQIHDHVHADGSVHRHADKKSPDVAQNASQEGQGDSRTPGHSHDSNCCGLFGFAAVLPALDEAVSEPASFHIQQPILTNCLVGCGPERINRPPILPLPL
jgi:hypothetical protein